MGVVLFLIVFPYNFFKGSPAIWILCDMNNHFNYRHFILEIRLSFIKSISNISNTWPLKKVIFGRLSLWHFTCVQLFELTCRKYVCTNQVLKDGKHQNVYVYRLMYLNFKFQLLEIVDTNITSLKVAKYGT